ncbi:MAG TPA: flagellar motor protein MotB [Aliidongia sp.]|nr:flagellar motor protein MotB [Aliidongia sp.]
MAKSNAIIVKRIKKSGHAHHGGAWKVAYADFVTAMMAFFLLLWLLNATTDAQKRGIADYFAPTLATKSTTSGAGGVLGGQTMTSQGSQVSSAAPPAITTDFNKPQDFEDNEDDDTPGKLENPNEFTYNASGDPNSDKALPNPNEFTNNVSDKELTAPERAMLQKLQPGRPVDASKLTEQQFQALKAEREEKQFDQAEHDLKQAIQQVPDLKSLAQNLIVDRTEEGLRIQLVDQEKNSMFPSGSTDMNPSAKKLMGLVAQAIGQMPNKIAITGHTDATAFSNPLVKDNWDLSAERANASRRALQASGLPESRIFDVSGKGPSDPFLPQDPNSPQNRRVSIVLLRSAGPQSAAAAQAPASAPAGQSSASPTPPVIEHAAVTPKPPGTTSVVSIPPQPH